MSVPSLLNASLMHAHLRTYPARFYYSNSVRPHKSRMYNYVSPSAKNSPAMAGPAGPVPVLMCNDCT